MSRTDSVVQRPSFFLRPGLNADDPISGSFVLTDGETETSGILILNADDTIAAYKVKADGTQHAKPFAKGRLPKASSSNPDAPTRRGFITSASGKQYALVAWAHDVETPEPYYVLQYSTLAPRQGKFY